MQVIRFKPDSARRRRLMTPEAGCHPAKMHMGILDEVVARYHIAPSSWVLDPMAGVGSTAMLALYGINVCLNELETHFVAPMKASWEKMRQHPMLGCSLGKVLILRGDARSLPIGSADAILTSPPFGEALSGGGIAVKGHFDDPGLAQRVYSPEVMKPGAKNIGDMRGQKYWGEEGMTAVYRECYRVLRQGGLMVLVVKGLTKDGKYVDLPTMTSDLVQSLGFVPFDHWRRELYSLSFWRILQKRRNPEAFDDRLNYEEVWAFRKPLAGRA